MQKSSEALADARKSIWKGIENKQWTYCSSFMSKTWFYSLALLFWLFCLLIRNFNSFCSSFYSLKIFTTMLIPDNTLIKKGSSFPPPRLFWAPRLFGREEYVLLTAIFHWSDFLIETKLWILWNFTIWYSKSNSSEFFTVNSGLLFLSILDTFSMI